ncbi:helix-turn-helix domain-containing protein [Streptomyces sp. PR69]|uniref:helix-turn-helix domain-containing protein n=1 Tax=Streptomyces sp. PR69 TaxID=2984950 RepID=UPI0022652FAE|nr:helix-turn-helix transcriptional regulator [Streptomyces sp. PR69]
MTEEQARGLGEYVKRLRKSKEWGVRELARRAGIDPAVVLRLESGHARQPEIGTLSSLASALEIPLVDMLAEAGQTTACGVPCIRAHLRKCYGHLPESVIREVEERVHRAASENDGA